MTLSMVMELSISPSSSQNYIYSEGILFEAYYFKILTFSWQTDPIIIINVLLSF